jgi:hypothetical protein
LRDTQDLADFSLSKLLVFEDFEDVVSDLGSRQELVGIFETQIRKDVP